MLHFYKNDIRGEKLRAVQHHAEANNKFMLNYDKSKENSFYFL